MDDPAPDGPDDPFGDQGENQANEVKAINLLRGAAHVVQVLTMSNDPIRGISLHDRARWVYMEWLHNGTLEDFLERAEARDIPLPNRLMWRILMCLIRMVIAMSWPEAHQPDNIRLERPQRGFGSVVIRNRDIQDKNLMFGQFEPSTGGIEHTLAPIMKMIDFGLVWIEHPTDEDGFRQNVRHMMRGIIDIIADLVKVGRQDVNSDRTLDPDLRAIAMGPTKSEYTPPKLEDLFDQVSCALVDRTAAWYATNMNIFNGSENDDAVRALTRELILVPSMRQL
ncbi:hypothetical protein SUNI508_07839 [Seiridium unicorne]|uniref:Protein kinase domain-containing protein n=1 Tax=Seiridium unicorne TaxID=138068 RepID=A0ABR2UV81_9PEZI